MARAMQGLEQRLLPHPADRCALQPSSEGAARMTERRMALAATIYRFQ